MRLPTSPADDYLIPAACNTVEYEVKKSRFIAWACPAADRAQALQWLSEAQKAYPDARHHCWAYQIGPADSPTTAAMSDDGEPSGTAGKPILNVLQHKDIGDIMVIVIRYFGGIKLGAGGLVRAYSHAAQLSMEKIVTETKVAYTLGATEISYEHENSLRQWLEQHDGIIQNVNYAENAQFTCRFPYQHKAKWRNLLRKLNAEETES